jgi:class 3 adenylate cyclase
MLKATNSFRDANGNPVLLRIGVHSSPAIAGVIGTYKFSYDLWGDTVNTAARMEGQGESGKIQVSEATYKLLKKEFNLEERGTITVKGKGPMKTWWLLEKKRGSNKLLPR